MIEQHNSLAEKFLKKGFWLYIFSFIMYPVSYVIKIILSWELSVGEVWIIYGVISIITMISSYNDLWITESLKYFIPKFVTDKKYNKVKTILVYSLIAQTITGLLIALIFFLGADFLWNNYFNSTQATQVIQVFALYFLWINIFQIISTFFLSIQNTLYHKVSEGSRLLFILISVILTLFLDIWSVVNFSYSWIIWLYVWIIIAIWLFYKKYYLSYFKSENIIWSKKMFSEIFKYSSVAFLSTQWVVILSQVDMQMIIYLLWVTDAGFYTNYLTIISIALMLMLPILSILIPIFSELYSKNEVKKITYIKKIFTRYFLVIGTAINILFFIFAEQIAFILFWEKFITSGLILKYSILFIVFNILLQINFHILSSIWRVKEKMRIIFIAIFINIILNYVFIQYLWVGWAALATAIWWMNIYIMSEFYLWKTYRVKIDWIFTIKNILLLLWLWIISYIYILPLLNLSNRWASFIYMSIITILYMWIFWIFNYTELQNFVRTVKNIKK